MNWIYHITNFLIGSCLASHAALICDRFEEGNFIFGRSHCASCQNELSILDELPIISYFYLHGKCRYCHKEIPPKLPLIEMLGGLAFLKVDFSQFTGICSAIVIFCLLLAAISDYDHQEFHLAMILPALLLAIFKLDKVLHFKAADLVEVIPVATILVFYCASKKMGTGDLIVYLILVLFYSPQFANQVFLAGSLLLISQFMLEKKSWSKTRVIPFVPYLFGGLILRLSVQ